MTGLHDPINRPSCVQGSVFRARWRGTQVALKRINHCSSGDTNLAVSREVMVGQVMSHPNLVSSSFGASPPSRFLMCLLGTDNPLNNTCLPTVTCQFVNATLYGGQPA